MADYPGSGSNSTLGANLKEVYAGTSPAKKFRRLKKMLGTPVSGIKKLLPE